MSQAKSALVALAVIAVVIVGLAVFAASKDSDEPSGPALSVAECNELQTEFDREIARVEEFEGQPAADLALAAVDRIDRELRDGGCYGD